MNKIVIRLGTRFLIILHKEHFSSFIWFLLNENVSVSVERSANILLSQLRGVPVYICWAIPNFIRLNHLNSASSLLSTAKAAKQVSLYKQVSTPATQLSKSCLAG
jgi:hypothetical protein